MSVIAKVKAAVAEAERDLTSSLPSTLNSRPPKRSNTATAARSVTSSSQGPEHMDGFFRNLSLDEDEAADTGNKPKFRSFNQTVSSRQRSRISEDSLSSSSGSEDEESADEDETGRRGGKSRLSRSQENLSDDSVAEGRSKGPRPAYSESNMHNSLGYLP